MSVNKLIKEEYLRLTERNKMKSKTIKESMVKKKINEEIVRLSEAVEERKEELDTKLEEIRKEIMQSGKPHDHAGATPHRAGRPQFRIPIETVARLVDCSVNELMLHFLNGQRLKREACDVEYSQGNVLFYGNKSTDK